MERKYSTICLLILLKSGEMLTLRSWTIRLTYTDWFNDIVPWTFHVLQWNACCWETSNRV